MSNNEKVYCAAPNEHFSRYILMLFYFQSSRPADPTNLDFELNEEFINKIHDGFLKGDISVGQRRHLIFATDAQL